MLIFSLGDRIHILAIGSITLPETKIGSISLPQFTLILEACITYNESNDSRSPSMEEVARRLECDRITIFSHFPSLCHAISAKYLNDRKAILLRNVQQSCDEVR
ncbi:hypothetical protein [Nostoc sp.]|uniref:hypothetical protein n=1 Tax=Nostoc sp. TaxID=1180 RepID=UPI002FF46F48